MTKTGNKKGMDNLIKDTFTTFRKKLTPDMLGNLKEQYNGNGERFIKDFYTTFKIELTPDMLTNISSQYLKKKEPTSIFPIDSGDVSRNTSNLPLFNSPLNPNLPESKNPAAQGNAITPGEQSINGSLKVPKIETTVAPVSPIETLKGRMTNSLGDVDKNASTPYPVVGKQQKSELLKQRATLSKGIYQNPENQQKIANIDNTLSLYAPETKNIYQDLKKSVGNDNMSWFITPQQQQETRQQLLAKYGAGKENVIDNAIHFFNTTNSRKAFYDTGKQLDKQEGVTDKEQEANYNMAKNSIFSGKEGQAEELYGKIKQEMTNPIPNEEEINKAQGTLDSLGYNASHWKDYNAGYRIVKKDETTTGYDNLVNNYINHYKEEDSTSLQGISNKNFVVYKALLAKVNQLKPVIQQINENKLNSMLPEENAQPLKPISIPSLSGSDYNAKVKGEATVLNPTDPNYKENTNRLEEQYKALMSDNGQLEQAHAAFEASVRALKVKQQPPVNVEDLLKGYEGEKKQFEKQPILKGGTIKELNVKAVPTTSYWYNASQHPTSDFSKFPEKTQKFLMAISNQRESDVVSGSILDAESIKKIAPPAYIKAVDELKAEAAATAKGEKAKAEWFRKKTLSKIAAAASYQNPGVKLVQQPYMSGQLGKMTTPVYEETGKPSEKLQQREEIDKDADTIGKLSGYAKLLEGRIINGKELNTKNPNFEEDVKKYKEVLTAYYNMVPKYDKEIKGYQGKLKEFPYYVPYNDVHILSKLTKIPVSVFATLNSSITGKAINAIMLGNPDFRNYDPSGLVKTSQALIGLFIDAPLFFGLGQLAGGITDAAIEGMSKIKLTEGIASSINDFADATRSFVADGMSSADAVAQAAIKLPKDALKIKAALTVMSAAKQGVVLGAYNTINSILEDAQGIKNATQGSKVRYKGTIYTIFKSNGDKVRMITDNGNEKELTRAEYDKFVKADYGNVYKSGAVGLVGGALMPEMKMISESLMKAAGISNKFLNASASIATQAYAFAAAGSLIEKHKLPTIEDYTSAVIFFAGMGIGSAAGDAIKMSLAGGSPFAKYFKGTQTDLNNEELVKQVVELEKAISKDPVFGKKIEEAIKSHSADLTAADITKSVSNKDGHVVMVEHKGKGAFVTFGADVGKDGKVKVGDNKIVLVKPFDKETGVLAPVELADKKDVKVVSVQKAEDFKKELAGRILEEDMKPTVSTDEVSPKEASSKESTTTPEGTKIENKAVQVEKTGEVKKVTGNEVKTEVKSETASPMDKSFHVKDVLVDKDVSTKLPKENQFPEAGKKVNPIEKQPSVDDVKVEVEKSKVMDKAMNAAIDRYRKTKGSRGSAAEMTKIEGQRYARDIRLFKKNKPDAAADEVNDAVLEGDSKMMPKGYSATVIDSYNEPIVGVNKTIVRVEATDGHGYYLDVRTHETRDIGHVYGEAKTIPDVKKEPLLKSKTELRKEKFIEIDNELSDEIGKLASSLGITKSLTGEQRDKLIPVIAKITKLLAEKLILEGQELKDVVIEYLKHIKVPIDKDVEGIVQDNVDKLNVEPKKEEAPKEEPIKEPAGKSKGAAGISNKAQEAKAAELGADVPFRKRGISSQDAVTEGRLRYNAMNDVEKEAYFKDLRTRLNNKDPLKTMTKPEDLFISRARSVEMEGELNSLQHQIEETTGAEKKDLKKKLDDAIVKWQNYEASYVNPLKNKWSKEGHGMQGMEDIEDGTLTAFASLYTKARKRVFTPKDRMHFADIAYEINKMDKKSQDNMRRFFLSNVSEDVKTKRTVQQYLRDASDSLDKLKIHRPGVFAAATPASLAYDLGIDAVKLSLRGAAKGIDIAEAIGKAINNGIDTLKKTDWYKKLSDKDAEEVKSQFILSVNKGLANEGFKAKDKVTLKKEVEGKKEFTAKEARDIWQYAKDNYVNMNESGAWTDREYQGVINAIGKDLGMKAADVEKAITDPKTDRIITEEKQQILDAQRKFMSTARRMKSIRELPDLRTAFADRKGSKFTFAERQRIWAYTKANYSDLGINDMGQIVQGLASDLGITTDQALNIFAKSKTGKVMTNEQWDIASRRRKVIQNAKYEIEYGNSALALKILRKIPRLFFSVKVLWHFGVGGMTHAGMYVFTPEDWGKYLRNFGKQYLLATNSRYYEKQMFLLKQKPDYLDWARVGLGINPDVVYTDYEMFGKFLDRSKAGSFIKHMNDMGTRGFGMLKLLRYEVAHEIYRNASASAKSQFVSSAIGYSYTGEAKDKEVLRKEVSGKSEFTPKEAEDIIQYAHSNYINDNPNELASKKEYNRTISSVAKDLDLKPKAVESIITMPRIDDVLRKEIALLVNHSTGASNIRFSKEHQGWDETLSAFAFAWRLEASRVARLTAEPGKGIVWLGSKDPAKRVISHILLKRIGEQIATYGSMLALNQALLKLVGSKQKINFFNPDKYDWLMFQLPGGHTVDVSGGMRGTLKFGTAMFSNFFGIVPRQVKKGVVVKRGDTMGGLLLDYLYGKESPMAQFIARLVTGESYNGQEIYWESARSNRYQTKVPGYTLFMETVMPLPIESMYTNYKEGVQRIEDGMTGRGVKKKERTMFVGSFLYGAVTGLTGIRIGTARKEEIILQTVLEKHIATNTADILKSHRKYVAAQDVRKGDLSKVREGINKGWFGVRDVVSIVKEAQPDVVQDINRASLKNLIDTYFNPKAKAFLDANPSYKRYMILAIEMKRNNLLQRGRWNKRSKQDKDTYTPYLIKWGNEMKVLSKEKK